jgi:hypothetical protein
VLFAWILYSVSYSFNLHKQNIINIIKIKMSKTKNTSYGINTSEDKVTQTIGVDLGKMSNFGTNNVLIGIEAGINLTTESDIVIIGDYIHDLDKNQKNVLFIGEKVAIGKTLFGKPIDLFDTIIKHKV